MNMSMQDYGEPLAARMLPPVDAEYVPPAGPRADRKEVSRMTNAGQTVIEYDDGTWDVRPRDAKEAQEAIPVPHDPNGRG